MADRFEQTAADAHSAIEDAQHRQEAARRRRRELDARISELGRPQPPYGPALGERALAEARERLASAEQSCARAQERARQATARR